MNLEPVPASASVDTTSTRLLASYASMLLTRWLRRSVRATVALLFVVAVLLSVPGAASSPSPEPESVSEVRALWVLRSSLASPASIAALVQSARDHGFNTLLVQVRGRGDAY